VVYLLNSLDTFRLFSIIDNYEQSIIEAEAGGL
jgi:hypothetical protein